MEGLKESENKLNYELDWDFIEEMAFRMSKNKGKYPPYNWKNSIELEKLKQSLFRHVKEIMSGNMKDDGDEFGHLAATALNAMFIYYQLKNKQTKEDIEFKGSSNVLQFPQQTFITTTYPENTTFNYQSDATEYN